MPELPIQPRYYTYNGRDPRKRQEIVEKNAQAAKAVRTLHEIVLKRSNGTQIISHALVASEAGVPIEIVRYVLRGGADNGMTFLVTPEIREELRRLLGFV